METILVVDDEPRIRKVVELYLRRAGYAVLRRVRQGSALQQHGKPIRNGDLQIDPASREVLLSGQVVGLRPVNSISCIISHYIRSRSSRGIS
jgi:DNA-binding response OmpR family regulator